MHRVNERDVVDEASQFGQQFGDHLAALAHGLELPGRAHQCAILTLERDCVHFGRSGLPGSPLQFRLVIPEIDVRGGSGTEDLQNSLRLGLEMGFPFPRGGRSGQERSECNTLQAGHEVP